MYLIILIHFIHCFGAPILTTSNRNQLKQEKNMKAIAFLPSRSVNRVEIQRAVSKPSIERVQGVLMVPFYPFSAAATPRRRPARTNGYSVFECFVSR
jgi:hypothetical protein